MNTLHHYESTRNIKPTDFNPPHLKDYTIDRYLVMKGTAKNKRLTLDLFDSVHSMVEHEGFVKAIAYRDLKPTVLILKKPITVHH